MDENRKFKLAAYPLSWPEGWKRTPSYQRQRAKFGKRAMEAGRTYAVTKEITVFQAIERIVEQLGMMGVSRDDLIVSTNLPTRLDGLPRSDAREPSDPGAAVYFRKGANGVMRSIAIDQYDKVAGNLGALAATLEAMRAIKRHGSAEILERTFTGFAALPAQASSTWRETLGFTADQKVTLPDVDRAFRELSRERHPDHGGNAAEFAALTEARASAKTELIGAVNG